MYIVFIKNKDKKEKELANIYDATQEIENNLFDNQYD